jgi:hypothetical protein
VSKMKQILATILDAAESQNVSLSVVAARTEKIAL